MNPMDLLYFRAVAKYQNLSRASEELFVSQPGLSRSISRLEEDLKIKLFDRRKGNIALTEQGKALYEAVDFGFSIIENKIEDLRIGQEEKGLTIACTIDDFLADNCKQFVELYPMIKIRQVTGSIMELLGMLKKGGLDVIISANPLDSELVQNKTLSQCPFVLICNRKNPLADGNKTVSLKEIQNEIFICETPRLSSQQLRSICVSSDFIPKVDYEVNNGYILLDLLNENRGVSIMPQAYFFKLSKQKKTTNLVMLHIADNIPPSGIYISCQKKKTFLFLQ